LIIAKPLNFIGKSLVLGARRGSLEVLLLATHILRLANEDLIAAFSRAFATKDLLPQSRVANIATASLAPMLASLSSHANSQMISQAVDVSVQAAAYSIDRLPELAAKSSLGRSQYDIRGKKIKHKVYSDRRR